MAKVKEPVSPGHDPNDLTETRLADLGDDVIRRWTRLEDSASGDLEDRIALGEQLQEAWLLLKASKRAYGRWLDAIGWKNSKSIAWHHRMLFIHAAKAKTLFVALGTNSFDYKRFGLLMETAPHFYDAVRDGRLTIPKALEKARREEELKARKPKLADIAATVHHSDRWLLEGDCIDRMAGIPDDSVDLVILDPPYHPGALDLTERVVKASARVLVPGGVLAVLTGQMELPKVLAMLETYLSYGWTYAVVMKGSRLSRIVGRRIDQAWKPVVCFTKGPWPSGRIDPHRDVMESIRSKARHRWEQDPAVARYLIEHLTVAGGVVLDPMMGTGSTGVAAVELGRKFIGIEADHERFLGCVERLEQDSGEAA